MFFMISSFGCGILFCVVILLRYFIFYHLVTGLYLWANDSDIQNIFDQTKKKSYYDRQYVIEPIVICILITIILSKL